MPASRTRPTVVGKAPLVRPLADEIPVIELTDSEDDSLEPPASQKVPLKDVAPGSLDNIMVPMLTSTKAPVLRPNDGDENAPPQAMATSSKSTADASTPPKADLVIPQDPLAQVLEVVPDVQAAYAQELLAQHDTVEAVVNALFENPRYPKIEKNKGKRKAEELLGLERGVPKPKVDYASTERPLIGGNYFALAIEQLQIDYPLIPKAHLRNTLLRHKTFYAPTYLFLREERKLAFLPYRVKTIPYRSKGKSKAESNVEFMQELEWLRRKVQGEGDAASLPPTEEPAEDVDDGGIECGCCFTSYPFEKMVQCPDAHLFCSECIVSYAENQLGSHNPNIVCMDQSGCKLHFPESELKRFLSDKLWELYERVKQRKEIEAAGLVGLEECPFCEYKVVMENPDEKLFRCEREECGAVSCRACKKLDHLPKTCMEVDEDRLLDGRHTIEEAMTQALLRNCPKCQKAFIKESGCNKMTCPHCQTLSCYVCREIINGYDHFNQNPHAPQPSNAPNKCLLWDQVEKRHADEVKAAAERAMQDYRQENPDVDAEDIKVDLPPAPPPAGAHPGPAAFRQVQAVRIPPRAPRAPPPARYPNPLVAPPVHHLPNLPNAPRQDDMNIEQQIRDIQARALQIQARQDMILAAHHLARADPDQLYNDMAARNQRILAAARDDHHRLPQVQILNQGQAPVQVNVNYNGVPVPVQHVPHVPPPAIHHAAARRRR